METDENLPEVGAGAPNPAKCRAKTLLGTTKLTRCLTEFPGTCLFFSRWGYAWFCKHPQRERIITRTLAEQPPAD
jgi:hypothetical protein